jgi:hypothetical protein
VIYDLPDVVCPSFQSVVRGKLVKLTEPLELRGSYVLVDAHACANSNHNDVWCMQVNDHHGPCWRCSEELYMSTRGAWAKLVTD